MIWMRISIASSVSIILPTRMPSRDAPRVSISKVSSMRLWDNPMSDTERNASFSFNFMGISFTLDLERLSEKMPVLGKKIL